MAGSEILGFAVLREVLQDFVIFAWWRATIAYARACQAFVIASHALVLPRGGPGNVSAVGNEKCEVSCDAKSPQQRVGDRQIILPVRRITYMKAESSV